MAILSVNGLDTLTAPSDFFLGRAPANDFTSFSGTVNYLPTGGVTGGGALEITAGAYITRDGSEGAGAVRGLLGWFKLPAGFSSVNLITVRTSVANISGRVTINTNGSMTSTGQGGTVQMAPAGTFKEETFYYFCIAHNASNSGYMKIKINNRLFMHSADYLVQMPNIYYYMEGGPIVVDDICVVSGDETALPPQLIYTLSPNADGSAQDMSFTGGASAWESIDEKIPDGDTSYIFSDTVGHTSNFALEDLPAGVTDIKAVQGYGIMAREPAGGTNNLRLSVKTAASAVVGTTDALLTDGVYNTLTPGSTETAYTPGDVNGMTVEFEVIA